MKFLTNPFILSPLVITLLIVSFIFLKRKILFNHKRLALVAKRFYNYFYTIKGIQHLRVNNYGYAPVDDEIKNFEPDLQYGMQLYKEVIKNHHGYMINEKLDHIKKLKASEMTNFCFFKILV